MATFTPLADAIAAMLNGHDFSREFTAERIYDSLRDLETLETMRVDVLLGDKQSQPMDRSRQENTVRVEIACRQAVKQLAGGPDEKAELDALVGFMEEIDDFLTTPANRRPPAALWAGWQKSELLYPFLVPQLRGRIFASVLRLSYYVATGPA
jgi:hypothetical protein